MQWGEDYTRMVRARMIGVLPGPAVIVPTRDDVDPTIELAEIILGLFLSKEREIPQMIDDIVRFN